MEYFTDPTTIVPQIIRTFESQQNKYSINLILHKTPIDKLSEYGYNYNKNETKIETVFGDFSYDDYKKYSTLCQEPTLISKNYTPIIKLPNDFQKITRNTITLAKKKGGNTNTDIIDNKIFENIPICAYISLNTRFYTYWELLHTHKLINLKNETQDLIKCLSLWGPDDAYMIHKDFINKPKDTLSYYNEGKIEAIVRYFQKYSINYSRYKSKFNVLSDVLNTQRTEPIMDCYYSSDDSDSILLLKNIKRIKNTFKNISLFLADGTYRKTLAGHYSVQEQLNIHNYLCNVVIALSILKKNGNFVLKILGLDTVLSKQIIQLLSIYFNKVSIVKPITDSYLNNVIYIVAIGYLSITSEKLNDLYQLVNKLEQIYPNSSSNRLQVDNAEYRKKHYIKNVSSLKNPIYGPYIHSLFDFSEIKWGIDKILSFNIEFKAIRRAFFTTWIYKLRDMNKIELSTYCTLLKKSYLYKNIIICTFLKLPIHPLYYKYTKHISGKVLHQYAKNGSLELKFIH
jgi:hypothetical protein